MLDQQFVLLFAPGHLVLIEVAVRPLFWQACCKTIVWPDCALLHHRARLMPSTLFDSGINSIFNINGLRGDHFCTDGSLSWFHAAVGTIIVASRWTASLQRCHSGGGGSLALSSSSLFLCSLVSTSFSTSLYTYFVVYDLRNYCM